MKPFPPTLGFTTLNDCIDQLRIIGQLRQEDITEYRTQRFVLGRLRTDRAVPTSVTVTGDDSLGDVVRDGDKTYVVVNTGSAYEWRCMQLFKPPLARSINTTAVGNVNTGEDDLITYSVPAGTLAADGDSLEISAWGTFAANANNKTIKIKFGATTILDTGAVAANSGNWVIRATVVRTGAATQQCFATLVTDNATLTDIAKYTTAAETLANAITLKCTGEATTTNDIIQKGMKVILERA